METLQRTANRGSISTGYDIDNSVKLEPDNTEMLYTGSLTAGNRRTWTISMWVKRTELSYESAFMYSQGTYGNIRFFTDDKIVIENHNLYLITNRVFRDTLAWYHVVWVNDSTQSTASNRSKLYINGVQETSFSTETYMSQNEEGNVNSTSGTYIGRRSNEVKHFAGYIADVYKVDGQALAPTAFGEFDEDSGIWKPKAYTGGSYSTQGFHLDFSDSSDLGNDSSGENHDFLLQNISAADQAVDTPTNNFCTLVSPQQFVPSKTASLVKEGGTTMFGGNVQGAYSSMGIRSGKWYFESTITNSGGVNTENHGFGCIAANRLYEMNIAGEDIGADVGGWSCAGNANPRNNNAGASGANYVTSPAVDVVLGCAIDMDNGKIWWHNAGTWHSLNSVVGNPATGASPAWSNLLTATDDFVLPAAGLYQTGSAIRVMNFGGYALPVFTAVGTYSDANGHGSFSYAPPTGYYALCTKNLAEYG